MAASKNESEVILNRANVALARSQRLVASWLPAQTEDELANAKSEEELQREEDEIFTAVPETLVESYLSRFSHALDCRNPSADISSNEVLGSARLSQKKRRTEAGTALS